MSGYDYAPEMQDPGDGDMFGAIADAAGAAASKPPLGTCPIHGDYWTEDCTRCDWTPAAALPGEVS